MKLAEFMRQNSTIIVGKGASIFQIQTFKFGWVGASERRACSNWNLEEIRTP